MARQQTETLTNVKHDEHRLTIRLSGYLSDKIDFLIESGQYETKVDFVRTAIESVLNKELEKAYEKNMHQTRYFEEIATSLQRMKTARDSYYSNKEKENALVHR